MNKFKRKDAVNSNVKPKKKQVFFKKQRNYSPGTKGSMKGK